MKTNWTMCVVGVGLWLSGLTACAQYDSLVTRADRFLGLKAYGRAIEAYSELLTEYDKRLTPDQKLSIKSRLANAYKKVGNGAKAEQYYRETMSVDNTDEPGQMLDYARTLADNGKLREAQQQYEQYLQIKDKQRLIPDSPPEPGAGLRNEKVRYRLEYLALNSKDEEFSPAFYRDGLVYVGGRKGGAAIETRGGGGAGYLDLFYVPNRNNLKAGSVIRADGSMVNVSDNRRNVQARLGEDSYSRPTANDSKTVPGFYQGIVVSEGLGYDGRSINPAQRFSRTINTRYHEGPATFSKDGSRIIFTRNNYSNGRASKSKEGVTKLKLYTATLQNGAWTDVKELPFNSNEYSVGHPTLSFDEQSLYFASDMPGGFGGTDLYVSRYINGQWGRPVNLGPAINTKKNELFPFIDETGNLYFSSDGHKGLGALDIFVVNLAGGDQATRRVEHLNAPINSSQDDFGLITDKNQQGGYFSSNRRNGNDDIYRFVRESSRFGCRNLTIHIYDTQSKQTLDSVNVLVQSKGEGQPDRLLMSDTNGNVQICLQSSNDFTFKASRDGYITSVVGFTTLSLLDDQPSRLEIGMVKPRLVMDTILTGNNLAPTAAPLVRSRIHGVVTGARNRQPIEGVTVRIRNECNHTERQYITGADGRYSFDIIEGCDYTLVASKPAFGTNTNRIKRIPQKTKPKEVSADLRMLSVGDVVTIDNIYYDLDHSSLRDDAARELDKVVATMRKYPSLVIEIRSHTDSRGDAERNKALSLQRAKAVANYLASKGINRKRMTTLGMGESQLVNNCTDGVICTEAEHQRNRRTEFRVVDIR